MNHSVFFEIKKISEKEIEEEFRPEKRLLVLYLVSRYSRRNAREDGTRKCCFCFLFFCCFFCSMEPVINTYVKRDEVNR